MGGRLPLAKLAFKKLLPLCRITLPTSEGGESFGVQPGAYSWEWSRESPGRWARILPWRPPGALEGACGAVHSCPRGEPPAHPHSACLSCSCALLLERSWLALGLRRPDAYGEGRSAPKGHPCQGLVPSSAAKHILLKLGRQGVAGIKAWPRGPEQTSRLPVCCSPIRLSDWHLALLGWQSRVRPTPQGGERVVGSENRHGLSAVH